MSVAVTEPTTVVFTASSGILNGPAGVTTGATSLTLVIFTTTSTPADVFTPSVAVIVSVKVAEVS